MSDDVFEDGDDTLVDWDNVADVVDTPVAAGDYNGTITACEYKLSQSSSQPMWATEITITSGGDAEGRKIFENFSFSEKAIPYTKKKLGQMDSAILGIKPFNLKTIPETLVGKEVRFRVKVKEETYEGETRMRSSISKFLPAGDPFLDD